MEQEDAASLVRADGVSRDMFTQELRALLEPFARGSASPQDVLLDKATVYTLLQAIKRAMQQAPSHDASTHEGGNP